MSMCDDQDEFVVGFLREDGTSWFLPVAAVTIERALETGQRLAKEYGAASVAGVWLAYEIQSHGPEHIRLNVGDES
jgi:hypothetical protein